MSNSNGNIVKLKATLNRVLFPKFPIILGSEGNEYGIVSWYPTLVLDGEVETDNFGGIVIKGEYNEDINPTKEYTLLAKEVVDEVRGKQYELLVISEIIDLSSVKNQQSFLKTFLTDNQINEMFKVLENPLDTIAKHNVKDLMKVHGIGDYIANCIIERFEENKDNCAIYLELDKYGLTPKFIQKLIKQYKNPNKVIEIVKTNPYQLTYDVDGIGFKTSDAIALKVGISQKSPQRISAFINYVLRTYGENGNSFILAKNLTAEIYNEFNGKENILDVYRDLEGNMIGNNISEALNSMVDKGIIVIEDNEIKGNRRIYLKTYYELEKKVSDNIKRIAKGVNKFKYDNWKDIIAMQENMQGWKFADEQIEGIKLGLDSQVSLITGGAGVGKSTLVSGIVSVLKGYSLAQCALSGKAGARLQEVTGKEGFTIHRLLGFKPMQGFTYNKDNKLPYDIIILDEISLVGGDIFLSLLEAIEEGTKLIILGDMGQLESIGCMNLASDLNRSKFIKSIELTKTHRQAQKSGIITSSKKIREGIQLYKKSFVGEETIGELQDMHFVITDNSKTNDLIIMDKFKEFYDGDLVNKDIMNIQVLCPVKERGNACVNKINKLIQEYVNPHKIGKNELKISYGKNDKNDNSFIIREGDKVMCIKNNYKISGQSRTGIFNGWVGIVKRINPNTGFTEIYFPIVKDVMLFCKEDIYNNIILGYASTVHKYQGSSAKVVIGIIDNSTPPQMLTKELLYTLITRAEKDCTLVAQNTALYKSINTSGVSDKDTFLVELLDKDL